MHAKLHRDKELVEEAQKKYDDVRVAFNALRQEDRRSRMHVLDRAWMVLTSCRVDFLYTKALLEIEAQEGAAQSTDLATDTPNKE